MWMMRNILKLKNGRLGIVGEVKAETHGLPIERMQDGRLFIRVMQAEPSQNINITVQANNCETYEATDAPAQD